MMRPMTRLALAFMAAGVMAACADEPPAAMETESGAGEPPAAVRTEPAAGGVATMPFTLVRVWFNDATDLDASELALEGPAGSISLTGIHSMGEGDLMAAVSGAASPGDYTLTWTAAGADGATATGEVRFTVSADESDSAGESDAASEDPPPDDGA